MVRRTKTKTVIPDATPILIDDVFPLGSAMMGRLSGNATNQEAKLSLYLDDDEEDDFERLAVKDIGALETLCVRLRAFLDQMKSRGQH